MVGYQEYALTSTGLPLAYQGDVAATLGNLSDLVVFLFSSWSAELSKNPITFQRGRTCMSSTSS